MPWTFPLPPVSPGCPFGDDAATLQRMMSRSASAVVRLASGDIPQPLGRLFLRSTAALLTLVLACCSGAPENRCKSGEQPMLLAQLFFGRNIGAIQGVSDAQFGEFVERHVATRFPAGLTQVRATGRWKAADATVIAERSDIVTLVVPDRPATHAELDAVRRDYISRFQQQSVLLTHQRVCSRV